MCLGTPPHTHLLRTLHGPNALNPYRDRYKWGGVLFSPRSPHPTPAVVTNRSDIHHKKTTPRFSSTGCHKASNTSGKAK